MLFQQWFRIYSEEVPCVQCSQFNTAISLGIIQFRKKYEEFFEFIFASKFYFQNTIRIQKKRRSFIGRKIIFLTGTLNAADADAHITSPTLFFSLSYGNIIARCSRRTTVVRTQSAFTFQYCVPLSAQQQHTHLQVFETNNGAYAPLTNYTFKVAGSVKLIICTL